METAGQSLKPSIKVTDVRCRGALDVLSRSIGRCATVLSPYLAGCQHDDQDQRRNQSVGRSRHCNALVVSPQGKIICSEASMSPNYQVQRPATDFSARGRAALVWDLG